MYSLISQLGWRQGLQREAPALCLSMVAAELFYKFHSFTLECLAFLATWCVVSSIFAFGYRCLRKPIPAPVVRS
jgi:hypothetical protein